MTDDRTRTDADADVPAGRLERLRRDRPELYAFRHVVKAAVKVGLAALGVGAVLRALLPRFDLGWLRDWVPGWLAGIDRSRIPDPLGWGVRRLGDLLPDVGIPGWLADVGRSARWWGPILIAVLVAVAEVERRRQADRDPDAAEPDATEEAP